jgi:hypothetical protein
MAEERARRFGEECDHAAGELVSRWESTLEKVRLLLSSFRFCQEVTWLAWNRHWLRLSLWRKKWRPVKKRPLDGSRQTLRHLPVSARLSRRLSKQKYVSFVIDKRAGADADDVGYRTTG